MSIRYKIGDTPEESEIEFAEDEFGVSRNIYFPADARKTRKQLGLQTNMDKIREQRLQERERIGRNLRNTK